MLSNCVISVASAGLALPVKTIYSGEGFIIIPPVDKRSGKWMPYCTNNMVFYQKVLAHFVETKNSTDAYGPLHNDV